MSRYSPTTPTVGSAPTEGMTVVSKARHNFLLLQALVAVVLSYQILFTEQGILPAAAQLPIVLGLLLSCFAIMSAPDRWVRSRWLPGTLALGDTVIVTALISVGGSTDSDLYLAYFVILLIATMSQTPKHTFLLISIVCGLYGLVLYREVEAAGVLFEQHLLRIPFLIVMGVFYSHSVAALRSLAEHDPLTGLPNHRTFVSLADAVLARTSAAQGGAALFFLNLDGFKLINDSLGRARADELLKEVASRLTQGPGRGYLVAREGGDEFALLVDQLQSPQECAQLAEDIFQCLEPPITLANREIFMTTSIGIALFPKDAEDTEALVNHADTALSQAKDRGRNVYHFYSAEMDAHAQHRLELVQNLRRGFHREEFRVFYQPQIDLNTGNIAGVEALVRWQHPDLGLIAPSQFIGVAEDTGLISPMGQWILREACRQVKEWQTSGRQLVRLSVNMSPRQLSQMDLVSIIGGALQETGLEARYLDIELVESLLLQEKESNVKTLQGLKSLGIGIALDDFGTGYSSLSYLKRFPIDILKIDESFIQDLTTSDDASAIVRAIIGMAHALNLKVIAEGVEKEEQAVLLRQEGCHEAQGFFWSRPLPGEEMAQLLDRWPVHDLEAASSIPRAVRPGGIQ